MFTGIVTEVGVVRSTRGIAGGVELEIEGESTAKRLVAGASVSINGACQTVVDVLPPLFRVQAVGSTIERTTLGRLTPGARVNLEASLRLGDDIGGHLVTGHIDGTARVRALDQRGQAILLTVELPEELCRFAAPRGSIALDGTSLTVAGVDGSRVTVSLIPRTIDATIARDYRPGALVNVEVDLLARYLDRLLASRDTARRPQLTLEQLKEGLS